MSTFRTAEGRFNALRWPALAVWLAIPVIGFAAQPLAGRIVWTIAVAALPLFIVLVGYHRWRRICPLAWFSQIPVRLGRPGKLRMPRWLEQHYYYISLGGFVLGLWLRLIWTNGDGVAIALFFAGLSLLALIAGALTTGKTWCNYLCPVSFIEKIYTEPIGLRATQNSQCTTCTACKKACPDINAENAYWKEIDLPSKRTAYFAYPGLIFGFYFYYFLQSGSWDYYFSGAWTDEPGVIWRAFLPGYDAASAGFFWLPIVPRALAALVTLLVCAALSWLMFAGVAERLVTRWARRMPAANPRNVVFALAAFAAFVTFYTFAGQPTLRRVDWLPTYAAILTVAVASFTLMRRLGRTQDAFAEQSVARNLVKRWQWGEIPPADPHDVIVVHQAHSRAQQRARSDGLQAYRDAVREGVAEGLITVADVSRLAALRDRLRISFADHERIMLELDEQEARGLSAEFASPEKRLQLVSYSRALRPVLECSLESDTALDSTIVQQLQDKFAVTPEEHQRVVGELVGRSPRAAEAVEALLARVREIDATLMVLELHQSRALDFMGDILRGSRERAHERIAALLPSSANHLISPNGNHTQASLGDVLRARLTDRDPYVRALALSALHERGAPLDPPLVLQLVQDENELVRETAVADASTISTLDKMLALREVSVFRHLAPASLMLLARAAQPERFVAGDALCVQGEPGHDVLVLLSGDVEVVQTRGRDQRVVNIQRAGEVIGEMAVLDPAPRSATVRVRSPGAHVLRLRAAAFRDVVAADGHVATDVIQILVRRLRHHEFDLIGGEAEVHVSG